MQRFFDIVFAALALLMLFPLLLIVSLTLKVLGEKEIFYFQARVGKNRKSFKVYKFATMLKDSEIMATGSVTLKNDPRVTPFGHLLRKSKVNELPQLLNILFGDMSVIGPRPQTLRCFSAYPTHLQDIICTMKPGLSGIGPIIFRDEEDILDETKGNLDFYDSVLAPYKASVEAWYSERQTITNYFLLIFSTVWVMVFPKSRLIWKVYSDLPAPPIELQKTLRYC